MVMFAQKLQHIAINRQCRALKNNAKITIPGHRITSKAAEGLFRNRNCLGRAYTEWHSGLKPRLLNRREKSHDAEEQYRRRRLFQSLLCLTEIFRSVLRRGSVAHSRRWPASIALQ